MSKFKILLVFISLATALLPPLCTAGFGLASGNYSYILKLFIEK